MPICFVVMGYGEKNDLATGRKLNLDATYKNVIKPAVEAAKYTCLRADEIRHSGVIDVPMYEMLFEAELVIADLSTANLNAMFELGVRHALKPRSTIIIAERLFNSPFDVNHIVIRKYDHLGTDIGFGETMRMRQELQTLIEEIAGNATADSPVYSLLPNLKPPWREDAAARAAAKAPEPQAIPRADSYAGQLEEASAAKRTGDWLKAKEILRRIYEAQKASDDPAHPRTPRPRVVQELALATYKAGEREAATAGPAVAEQAYAEAVQLLRELDPEHTTDPETLGLWAAAHKRRAELEGRTEEQRRADLDAAIYASERGFLIRQDHYTGGNLAYLLDRRASLGTGDDRIADRVMAKRVRRKVLEFARNHIDALKRTMADVAGPSDQLKEEGYWTSASIAEALIGLGDPAGEEALKQAKAQAPADWMVEATEGQIAKLRQLLNVDAGAGSSSGG